MNVGFIGLGHMGSGMATNLIKAGHTVTVYNRTEERTEPLVALGAEAAKNLADACKGDAVFTMLANDDAVKSVVGGEACGASGRARPQRGLRSRRCSYIAR